MSGVKAVCEGGRWHGYTCMVPADVTTLRFTASPVQAAWLTEAQQPSPADGQSVYHLVDVRPDGTHVFAYAPGAPPEPLPERTMACCPVCHGTSLSTTNGVVHCTACPWDETLLA